MGILKKITDEYFGEGLRKEDEINFNTNELKPVDMGGTVLWADRNLKATNSTFEEHFSFKELYEYGFKFGHGWRIPTWKECRQLFRKHIEWSTFNDWRKFSGEVEFKNTKNGEKLHFDEIGFYLPMDMTKRESGPGHSIRMWTSDTYTSYESLPRIGYMLVYMFDTMRNNKKMEFYSHWEQYFPVRLVKDKK